MCPHREQLSAYLLGTLSEDAADAVARHLEGCSACQTAAAQLENFADNFVEGLRQLTEVGSVVDEPGCAEAIRRAALVGITTADEGEARVLRETADDQPTHPDVCTGGRERPSPSA